MEHITDLPECSTILTFIHVTCESIVEGNKKLKSEHETWHKFYYLCNLSFTVKFLYHPVHFSDVRLNYLYLKQIMF
jgi:hypothetical protein